MSHDPHNTYCPLNYPIIPGNPSCTCPPAAYEVEQIRKDTIHWQYEDGENLWVDDVRTLLRIVDTLRADIAAVTAERDALQTKCERLLQEAQIHAMEARTANATIAEGYQAVTGATGEPGNWHGSEPFKAMAAELAAVKDALSAIAKQDISDDAIESGDVENGYRSIVLHAREALQEAAKP